MLVPVAPAEEADEPVVLLGSTLKKSSSLAMPSWIDFSMAGTCSATPLMKIRPRARPAPATSSTTMATAAPRGMKRSSQSVSGSVMTARTRASTMGTTMPLRAR